MDAGVWSPRRNQPQHRLRTINVPYRPLTLTRKCHRQKPDPHARAPGPRPL